MTPGPKTSRRPNIVVTPKSLVKGKIVAAGLTINALATAAGLAGSTLSDYLAGRIPDPAGQLRIVQAFNRLTGQTLSARAFWGELAAEVLA